jgi:hypothetical protein
MRDYKIMTMDQALQAQPRFGLPVRATSYEVNSAGIVTFYNASGENLFTAFLRPGDVVVRLPEVTEVDVADEQIAALSAHTVKA